MTNAEQKMLKEILYNTKQLRHIARSLDEIKRVIADSEYEVKGDEVGACIYCRFAGCSECDDCINGSQWARSE